MNLTNNELTYEPEDVPKDFSFQDWQYLVPVLEAVSAKIIEVNQLGIYSNDSKRFSLITSEALTEQEVTDVLAAWTNFDATTYKAEEKSIAAEELRIQLGIKTKAYFGHLCEQATLSEDAEMNMLSDATLTIVDRLLLNGALEKCRSLLTAYTPTTYFPVEFQTAMVNRLTTHIAQVDAFLA